MDPGSFFLFRAAPETPPSPEGKTRRHRFLLPPIIMNLPKEIKNQYRNRRKEKTQQMESGGPENQGIAPGISL